MDCDQVGGTVEKLLAIWQDVLANNTCKADDDFLDAGGDSLAAMLCIARIHSEFGVELDLEDFFIEPATPRNLGKLIDDARAARTHQSLTEH